MIENIELSKFPRSKGVYWFKDVDGVIVYVGSSKNLHNRMEQHRDNIKVGCSRSKGKKSQRDLYRFLQVNQFTVGYQLEGNYLQLEQKLIEKYNPKFNRHRAYTGCGTVKSGRTDYDKTYNEKYKEERTQYRKTHKNEKNSYNNKHCNYNGEELTFNALLKRFWRAGIPHPTLEAKKYLIS